MTETNEQFAERMRLKRGEPPSRRGLLVWSHTLSQRIDVDNASRSELEVLAREHSIENYGLLGIEALRAAVDEALRERVVRLLKQFAERMRQRRIGVQGQTRTEGQFVQNIDLSPGEKGRFPFRYDALFENTEEGDSTE